MQESEKEDLEGLTFGINLNKWYEPLTDVFTDNKGEFQLHRSFYQTKLLVYVSKTGTVDYSHGKIELPQSEWIKVTKVKGKEYGRPLIVTKTGRVFTYKPNMHVKVFIKKVFD